MKLCQKGDIKSWQGIQKLQGGHFGVCCPVIDRKENGQFMEQEKCIVYDISYSYLWTEKAKRVWKTLKKGTNLNGLHTKQK
jgi:hypothetical protein